MTKDDQEKHKSGVEEQRQVLTRMMHIAMRVVAATVPVTSPGGIILSSLIDELQASRKSIDTKIDEASDSLKKAAELIDEIESNLKTRTQKLEVLKKEIERYSKLAEVEEEKADAILQQIEVVTNRGKIKERWVGFLINIGAGLLLGLLLPPVVSEIFQDNNQPAVEPPAVEESQPAPETSSDSETSRQ
ncbi:MAG: hypothetical protein AAGE59_22185 [Cyanobacteria bacterium P01_F01_bin.86]